MSHIVLDGDWQLYYAPENASEPVGPEDLTTSAIASVAARVPGNVELDLQRAGVLPDPTIADNIRRLRPYEFHQWWYVREFEMPPGGEHETWDLVFAGLDTLATVWLNGMEVGQAANMLIEHRFDIGPALRFGATNRLVVHLRSPVNYARQFHYDAVLTGADYRAEGLFVRKAPHMYGWDILPRAVSAGIWRSVWLESRPATAIEQIYYWTQSVGEQDAVVGARFQFRSDEPTLDGFLMRFHAVCGEHSVDYEWPCEFVVERCLIPIPDARLWWPKGYGDPNLYTITAQLCLHGEVVAERVERIGVRTVVVDRTEKAGAAQGPGVAAGGPARVDSPPDPESHFVFIVNGEPIMVKGSNWVPLDAFHSRDAERVDDVVGLFDDLGCNMIRCWGGNVYEDHHFFDQCDEKGILVWQDFAFACAIYPQTETFLNQVRVEVQAVVEKLRNHAALALWCGDNEIDGFYANYGLSPEQNRLTREIVPQVVHRCDPFRAFVPSSPYVPPSVGNAADAWMRTPEQHLWGPRGYFKSPFYSQHSAHFIGEMGYHGCPNVASIRRFISAEELWPWQDNDEWQVHAVYHWRHSAIDRDRIQLMANQILELFGAIPDDLETFALASQISQAEAKKFFIESTRLRKWRTSGVLWWNVIDGWPQFSDAIVDYYFGKKLAYHYIRRAQQPVCLVIGEPGPGKYLPVVVCNDTRRDATVNYRIWDGEGDETLVEGIQTVPANQNWQVGRIRTFASDQRLYLITWEVDGRTYGNHYVAGTPPFSLAQYRDWLSAVSALPQPFDAQAVAV